MNKLVRQYSVKVLKNTPKIVKLQLNEGKELSFLPLWLRDHCQCSNCIHPLSLQRKIDTFEILQESKNLKIESLKENDEENISIKWKSNQIEHESVYPKKFLEKYSQENMKKNSPFLHLYNDIKLWNCSLELKNGMVDYNEVMKNDEGLFKLLTVIREYGFCIINNTPIDSHKPTRDLIEKIGKTRNSIFGDFWEFTDDDAVDDTAYTNERLESHCDGTYSFDAPGIQSFHCIKGEYKNGESFLVDGFNVCQQLKKKNPEAFKFFSKFDFPHVFNTRNNETYLLNRTKIINTENEGNDVYCFRYNNLDRDILDLDPKNQELFYQYYSDLAEIVRSNQNEIRFTLKPGMLMLTNNWRVLHGRESFIGKRTIIGCYVNEEDYLSKLSTFLKK